MLATFDFVATARVFPQFGKSLKNLVRLAAEVFAGNGNTRECAFGPGCQDCRCAGGCAGDCSGCSPAVSSNGCAGAHDCGCRDCGVGFPAGRIRGDELDWDLPLSDSVAEVHLVQLFARGIDLVRVSPHMGDAKKVTAVISVYRRHASLVARPVTREDVKKLSAVVQALSSVPPEVRANLLYDMVQSETGLNTADGLCTYVGGGPAPCVDNGCFRVSDFLGLAYRRCEELIVGGVDPRKPRPPGAEPGGDPWGGNECLCVRYTIEDIPWWLRLLIELLLAACTAALLARVLGYLLRYRRVVGIATA